LKCPECGSSRLVREGGEIYCEDCGLVIEENIISQEREWRVYDEGQREERERCGPLLTPLRHDYGLGTLNAVERTSHNLIFATSSDKYLAFALSEIERIGGALSLPQELREEVAVLFRKIRGRNRAHFSTTSVVASLYFLVCKRAGVPRTLKEIAKASEVEMKKLRRTLLSIVRSLRIPLTPSTPSQFIPRFCSLLNLDDEVRITALEIARKLEKEFTHHTPSVVAAAIIFVASHLRGREIRLKEIAEKLEYSDVSIRKKSRRILRLLSLTNYFANSSLTTSPNRHINCSTDSYSCFSTNSHRNSSANV